MLTTLTREGTPSIDPVPLQGGSSINSNSVSQMAIVMGFVLCLAEARRLPGQNEGFPWIPGLMIRRNTTPHVQFRGPREFMVGF